MSLLQKTMLVEEAKGFGVREEVDPTLSLNSSAAEQTLIISNQEPSSIGLQTKIDISDTLRSFDD